jgi:hypothetical protein
VPAPFYTSVFTYIQPGLIRGTLVQFIIFKSWAKSTTRMHSLCSRKREIQGAVTEREFSKLRAGLSRTGVAAFMLPREDE